MAIVSTNQLNLDSQLRKMRENEKYAVKTTNWESFSNTYKAMIGVGFLSIPKAFKEVGIVGGTLGCFFIIFMSNISNYFLFKSLHKIGESTTN